MLQIQLDISILPIDLVELKKTPLSTVTELINLLVSETCITMSDKSNITIDKMIILYLSFIIKIKVQKNAVWIINN
ncbi:hypothetical protein [Haloplasma contractile]|uniref:Uncharacterized protein n=1 Tax=Haloplasma contractile SSD-17B TaxID=1033810 RepID=U2EA90_9MOLU|nr:hypothetical protein [Haloplasma contractile]ERJ11761.1 hypothetical protein HLPCO_002244 [Haloplasma contractile SSD-17B]